jgi:t-SNARE complex subunit (syntaxin)
LEETQKAQHDLREIVQRHNMLTDLERSLLEVHDMFISLSNYVLEQGSLLQVIEYETENAGRNIDKGADELEKARDLQIKALKKKTYILIILLIILSEYKIYLKCINIYLTVVIFFHFLSCIYSTYTDNLAKK